MKRKLESLYPALGLLCIPAMLITIHCLSGCQNGKWNTGNLTANAALTAAQAQLTQQALAAAEQVAQGNDPKKELVQSSGDAVRSLEGIAITAVQPAVTQILLKWVPKKPEWQGYAHNVAGLIATYVQAHGNTSAALKAALEAVAVTLNTY